MFVTSRFELETAMWKYCFAVAMIVASAGCHAENLNDQFLIAKLNHGAAVSVPRVWHIFQGNERRAIETSSAAAIDLSGNAEQLNGAELLITANFPDSAIYAGMTITTAPMPGITPGLAASLTDIQIRSIEASLRQGIEASQARLGATVFGWTPLRTAMIGRNVVLSTSYLRSSDMGERKVYIYKFFGSGRIYDMALSTSATQEAFNDAVLQDICNSFVGP